MAQFIRGKQAGIQNDLSTGIHPDAFILDDFARYGVNSQISALAYDPVQSLLAVGTSESQYGSGQIYIYGGRRVTVTYSGPRKSSIRNLRFCGNKLISVDSKNDICIFSLEENKILASYAPPGQITSLTTDPNLDYAMIGLQNGDIVAYDLDRLQLTAFRIPNLWMQMNPRARIMPVITLEFHPRDIGTLLVGYPEGAVIFSFKQNKAQKFFRYEVPRGAPGGAANPAAVSEIRHPRLTQATWHPTGTFILTAHDDASLVFWDPKDGRVVEARTLQDTHINVPSGGTANKRSSMQSSGMGDPYTRISWCSKENPDDTGLLIAGGSPTATSGNGLTFMDLGLTPNYQTSSWQILSSHFQNPKRQHILPTPPKAQVVDFLLIPRSSPHFAGSHDPIATVTLLSSGELITMSFPSGHPISPTNQLHISLTYVHPFVTNTSLAYVDRVRWMGMRENRQRGPQFLLGGAEQKRPLKRFESRNIVQTAHADGTVRVWDAGHGDEIENEGIVQVDLARAIGRFEDIQVSNMSMSGASGELSVGLLSGEVAIFRWNTNRHPGRDLPAEPNEGPGRLTNISSRADPGLKEGFLPLTLLDERRGPVTALRHSDVGFVAVGYGNGSIAIVDLRGPALIHTASTSDFVPKSKRGSIIRSNSQTPVQDDHPTCLEFGVFTLEDEDYSSIALFVGTKSGSVLTFKILPARNGTFSASFAGLSPTADSVPSPVIALHPIEASTGNPAFASQAAVGGLQHGHFIQGALIAVTASSMRIFKPATSKGAHKTFDDIICYSAAVSRYEDQGSAVVGVFGDGTVRAFSIPSLKEIGHVSVGLKLDPRQFSSAIISPTGDIIAPTGPSEMAIMNIWGTGIEPWNTGDQLYNPQAKVPPRPTISNLQWISGTQYITPADLDILIGGPDRPPSKRMIEEMRAAAEVERQSNRQGSSSSPDLAGPSRRGTTMSIREQQQSQEGYWAYMQRQVQERTERLGIAGDTMSKAEENSQGWADDVNKYVAKQKRQMVLGAIGSKFGF